MRLANDYREAWIDDKNDGLIFVMDIQSSTGGETGRSRDLYQGKYMEEGIMPRMLLSEVNDLIRSASEEMGNEKKVHLQVELFIGKVTDLIAKRLEIDRQLTPLKDDVNFMGIMAIGLLLVGLLIAIASKLLGRSDKKSARLYRFPDILVGERLGAPNGGGKISWTDFGSPSEQ